jgi:RNA polymerase sigma factor (sigma-70 family)
MQTRSITTLITRAQGGDIGAFTLLVRRHQDMAFAYAYSILGDFHSAEDAAQDAFLCVHVSLHTLRTPEAFPGWLRGIVRHQCHRLLRHQPSLGVPLEQVAETPARTPGPEEQWERRETRAQVLAAVRALPSAQREVTTLYYIQDYPISQIAAFLEVPEMTVKNRLHQARITLRRRMLPMVPESTIKETLHERALPDEFAQRVGRIVQVRGPFVDAEFRLDEVPALLTGLTVTGPAGGEPVVVEVVQHLGGGRVRGVALLPLQSLVAGGEAVSTGQPITQPLSPDAIAQVLRSAGGDPARAGAGEPPRLLETGIKAVDLLCPFTVGGRVGFFGDPGAGKAVLVGEIGHHLASQPDPLTLFAFVDSHDEAALLVKNAAGMPQPADAAQALFLPAADPTEASLDTRLDVLDAVVYLTKNLTERGLFPAIDPALSTSRLLHTALVSEEHVAVAAGVRNLLSQKHALGDRTDSLTDEEKTTQARGRRAELFLSQPFFEAEPFTKQPGKRVPLAETLQGFSDLLAGAYDGLPEESFLMAGDITEVIERAKRLPTE